MATVTGRSYTATRARGLAPWNPKPETMELLGRVNAVLTEYRDHLPLTARQIFYRLVGRYGYDKTEQAYSRLLEHLNRARRAQLIPWHALRDDGITAASTFGWDGPEQFWDSVRDSAEGYTHDLTDGQAIHAEVWVEAAGMVPQIARVAHEYGITVYSAGGFNSVTEKHTSATRFVRRFRNDDQTSVVLHIGDYDPSGCAIVDSAADDITAFCEDYGTFDVVEFRRVAVTPHQMEAYGLPTAPQKRTDNRGERMNDTVQAEALTPDQLANEVRAAIEEVVDLDQIAAIREQAEEEKASILEVLEGVET